MPSDEYDVNFVHAETGELVFLSSTVTVGSDQGYCDGGEEQLIESNFFFPPVPSDTFDLFERRNATELVAQSGLVVTEAGVSDFNSEDWATYTDLWFGSVGETLRIRLQFSSSSQGGRLEARLGGVTGEVVGTFSPWDTNGEFVDAAFDIEDADGLQQLTLTSSTSSDVIVSWLQLAPACFPTNFICLDDGDCCSNMCSTTGYCQPPQVSSAATYYMFYKNGGCAGRNELGIISTPVVEDCAKACDALPDCVSFEYKRGVSTRCQLSSTCSSFDLTVNDPTSAYMWYLKVNDEQIRSENPTPLAYLWLLDSLSGGVVTQPTGSTSSLYYVGYNTGVCIGRNELGSMTKVIVEDCAEACDTLSDCVSFEYKKASTRCFLSSTCDDFSLTVNNPDSTYMWYEKIDSYTNHVATGGNAYLWLFEEATNLRI